MSRIVEVADEVATRFQAQTFAGVWIEDTFYSANTLTLKILSRLAGAVYMKLVSAVIFNKHQINFVMPTEARKNFGLLPKSTKGHIVKAVNAKFGTAFKLKDNDEADAVVLAYHGWYVNSNSVARFDEMKKKFYKATVTSKLRTPRLGRKHGS